MFQLSDLLSFAFIDVVTLGIFLRVMCMRRKKEICHLSRFCMNNKVNKNRGRVPVENVYFLNNVPTLFVVPTKMTSLAYHWSIKIRTGLPLVI